MAPSFAVARFYLYLSNLMVTSTGDSFTVLSKIECARNCTSANLNCLSFFFDTLDNSCLLYAAAVRETDPRLVQRLGMRYYFRKRAKSCMDHTGYQYEGPGLCVKYVPTGQAWLAARDTCEADGGALVKIDSDAKNTFLKGTYGINGFCWTGGNDISVEGSWVWHDGTPIQGFDDWQSPDPSGGTLENCMVFDHVRWQSGLCMGASPFLCEI